MLQQIRDKAQGWISWVIMGLVSVTFALFGIHYYFDSSAASTADLVASINGVDLHRREFDAAYQHLLAQSQQRLGDSFSLTPALEKELKNQALQDLVIQQVLSQAAKKDGMRISPQQIQAEVANFPAFQNDGKFSQALFEESLRQNFYTERQFFTMISNNMLDQQMQMGLIASSFSLSNEVANAIGLVKQKRDFSYVLISAAHFKDTVKSDPADIKAYYDAHQEEFKVPEQIKIQYLMLSTEELAKHIKLSDEQLQQYYNENKDSFANPARFRIAHILVRETDRDPSAVKQKLADVENNLAAKKSFSEVAAQYSDDIVTAKKGGELPWFSSGQMNSDFEHALANMKNAGEVAGPIKTTYGYEFIKLLEKEPSKPIAFADAKARIAKMLAAQKAEERFADKSDQLADLTYANSTSLQPAADTLDLSVQTSDFFSTNGTKDGIAHYPAVVKAAFDPALRSQKVNSELIQLNPQTVVVIRIDSYKPAEVKPLSEVTAEIAQRIKAQEESRVAEKLGQSIIQDIQKGKHIDDVAKQNQLTVHKQTDTGRFDERINPLITGYAFQSPLSLPHSARPQGFPLPSGDYVVILVTRVLDGDISKLSSTDVQSFTDQMEQSEGLAEYQLYIENLVKHAKIKYYLTF